MMNPRLVYICRNSFSRETLYREVFYLLNNSDKTCDNCGRVRVSPSGGKSLFRYYVEQDGLNKSAQPIHGLFCSVECMRSYHS